MQFIQSRPNVVSFSVDNYPSSYFLLQTGSSFGRFDPLSLFLGQADNKAAFVKVKLEITPPFFGKDLFVLFELTVQVFAENNFVNKR